MPAQFTWHERRAERDERHQQRAIAALGRPGSSQEWRHSFAKTPAHGQPYSPLHHHLTISMEQSVQFRDVLDVDDSGAMNAHKLARVQSRLDLLQCFSNAVAMARHKYFNVLAGRLDELDGMRRQEQHASVVGQ